MYAKATEENLKACILRIKTRIGVLPFEIIKKNEDYQVIMTQGQFSLGPEFNDNTSKRLKAALSLRLTQTWIMWKNVRFRLHLPDIQRS